MLSGNEGGKPLWARPFGQIIGLCDALEATQARGREIYSSVSLDDGMMVVKCQDLDGLNRKLLWGLTVSLFPHE